MTYRTEDNLKKYIQELKEGKQVLPHDSYDASCCEGDNSCLRIELIKKLESLIVIGEKV
jgi:hypothetical protein